jgi:hypothetical protein
MNKPEPGEMSHSKTQQTDRDWSKHLKQGASHLEHHHAETRREPERKTTKGDR